MSAVLNPAYSDAFERFAATRADADARRAQFQRFAASGFPDTSNEDWHYTDLSALSAQAYALAGTADAPTLAAPLADSFRLVYLNGRCSARHSTAAALDGSDAGAAASEPVDALNAAFSLGGLRLKLGAGEHPKQPLVVLVHNESVGVPAMSHQQHRIELGANAEATVLLHFTGHGADRLSTQRIDITLGRNARLRLHRLTDEAAGATLVTRLTATLGRDANLLLSATDVGSGLAKHFVTVTLADSGAEVEANALTVPKSGAQVDNQFRIVHAAPHCRSRLNSRGIIDERAKAVFNGRVVVQPGAQKTDSEQRIANLLLSKKAEINAKPDLEIHADDVKCAHGCTVGQLDEKALGYLRSRGIGRDEARALLLRAFATEILDRLDWPALREQIESSLHLPQLAADEAIDWEDAA